MKLTLDEILKLSKYIYEGGVVKEKFEEIVQYSWFVSMGIRSDEQDKRGIFVSIIKDGLEYSVIAEKRGYYTGNSVLGRYMSMQKNIRVKNVYNKLEKIYSKSEKEKKKTHSRKVKEENLQIRKFISNLK